MFGIQTKGRQKVPLQRQSELPLSVLKINQGRGNPPHKKKADHG